MIKVVKKVPIMLAFATLVWFCGDAITLCRWGCQDVNYCGCAYAGGEVAIMIAPLETEQDVTSG